MFRNPTDGNHTTFAETLLVFSHNLQSESCLLTSHLHFQCCNLCGLFCYLNMGNSFFSFLLHSLLSIRVLIVRVRVQRQRCPPDRGIWGKDIDPKHKDSLCLSFWKENCNTLIAATHLDKNRSFLWNSEGNISYTKESLKVATRGECGYFL